MAKKKALKKAKSILVDSDETLGKEIKISCSGNASVTVDSLIPMQGKLKELSDENYQKLRSSIMTLGYSFPVFVWLNRGKNHIIDGHQRRLALMRMREEGFVIPKIPVVSVEAETRKEAAKKILATSSMYGKMSGDSLKDFIKEFSLDFKELEAILDIPQIDINFLFEGLGDALAGADQNAVNAFADTIKGNSRNVILSFTPEEYDEFVKLTVKLMESQKVDSVTSLVLQIMRKVK